MRRRGVLGLAAAVLALAASGCGKPEDDAWLRFDGFQSSSATVSVLAGDLNDGKDDSVDAKFTNASVSLTTTSGTTGVGILVYRAHVDYRLSGHSSPPSTDFPLSLFLAAGTISSGTVTATDGTVSLPLASASLKQWLLDTHAFDAAGGTAPIKLTAEVTFSAKTDDGQKLQVTGSLAIQLTNSGTVNAPQTVTVAATTPTAFVRSSTSQDGVFTVTRTGPTGSALTVYYEVGGTATAGTDFVTLDGVLTIAADSSTETIDITPLSGYTANATVVVTISANSAYTVGGQNKATVTLIQ